MTSVGYGDYVAQSYPGKCVIMFTALWGCFMISLFILAVSKVLEMTQQQERALRKIDMSRSAANAIACSFKYFVMKKKMAKSLEKVQH